MINTIFRMYNYKDELISYKSMRDSDQISMAIKECFNDNCEIIECGMDHRPEHNYFGVEVYFNDTSCGEPEKSRHHMVATISVNQEKDADNIAALKEFFV